VAFAVFQLVQQSGNILGFTLPQFLPLEKGPGSLYVLAPVLVMAVLVVSCVKVPLSSSAPAPVEEKEDSSASIRSGDYEGPRAVQNA
jgi:hypothetical protein